MHFSRGTSYLHPGATRPDADTTAVRQQDVKVKQEERPVCTKGYYHGWSYAEKCHSWRCQCALKGKCQVPLEYRDKVCQQPCLKHFPDPPYGCFGGRGRIMPNGCIIWQCNCPRDLMGKCVMPATVRTDKGEEPICKEPCTVHSDEPKCEGCGKAMAVKEWQDSVYCGKCW